MTAMVALRELNDKKKEYAKLEETVKLYEIGRRVQKAGQAEQGVKRWERIRIERPGL